MYRKTKILSLVLAVCFILVLFSGCGGGAQSGNKQTTAVQPTAQETKKDATVTEAKEEKIVVWGGVPGENGPLTVCEEFTKLNPNIKVEYFRYVNDDQGNLKLDTSLMAGEDIDVYFTHSDDLLAKRIQGGLAEDLTPWLAKDNFDMKDNYGDVYYTYDGKVYCLPTTMVTKYIYMNKDMLDAAGIPIPTGWTIDEYKEITKKLTKGEGATKVYGGLWDWIDISQYVLHVPTLGADSFYKQDGTSNFDNPVFKSSINLLEDLMLKDKSHISLIEYQTSKLTPYGEFLNQKTASMAASLPFIRYIKDTQKYPHSFITAFAPFPTINKGETIYGWKGPTGDSILMNSNSKHKESAFKFIKYFGTEGQIYMVAGGKFPSWKKINQDEVVKRALGENPEKLFDVESFKRTVFETPQKYYVNKVNTAYPQISKIWKEEVEKVIGGQQNADTAVANAKKRADDAIKEAGGK